MKQLVLSTFPILVLVGCNSPLGQENGISGHSPFSTADQIKAKVGEPVEVTLTADFKMFSDSRIPQDTLEDLKLGACFTRAEGESGVSVGGLCYVGEKPLQSWVSTLDSETIKDFGDFVVKRGETRVITHTFTFTSTEPGEVAIKATKQYQEEGYDSPLSAMGGGANVTFE